ncbi:MAG: peptide-methionine (S)-S-oxide reductase MsrA [Hafnia sp.]|uniref:peptide-methionine (S)-S-oxide reductase MsrA n=1 Tax=Gammaproteobacteria TaxID=1236 RepID=UPI001D1812CD|nr:peptide-methionine (S)-S-oxide reductase MsrA [Acinetobacter junii]
MSGDCFWGVQGVFQHVKGVTRAIYGYAGGDASTAQYETVSSGTTGYAESVKVEFNPQQVSLGEPLRIYFSVAHDPTELNYQGPDTGTQYRSAIWTTNPEQQKVVISYIAQLDQAGIYTGKIVTQTSPLKGFYPAEDTIRTI